MIINISPDYRVASDTHSWMVQKRRNRKVKGKLVDGWEGVTWHATFQQAVQSLADRMIRASDAETLVTAIEDVRSVCTTLSQALAPQFEVNPNLTWKEGQEEVMDYE